MQKEFNSLNVTEKNKKFEDFLIILFRYGRLIFWNTIIITVLALIISSFMDKWYTSTASIIPPKKKGGLFGDIGSFSSTIKDISKTLGKLGGASDETYDYLAILQSRSTSERIIKKFGLRDVYEIKKDKPFEDVISELEANIKFTVEEEGNITIKVSDKNPQRAAEMANYFVEVLNEISIDLGTAEAKNNREFIEKRYLQVLKDLYNSEEALKVFSKKNSVFSLTEQTKAAVTEAAQLKAEVTLNEIKLNLLNKGIDKNNPLILDTKLRLDEFKKKLNAMKVGESQVESKSTELFVPFNKLPDVGTQYVRLFREFELQNKLLEFILPIYEQAKIEEQKNIPVALVLDKAIPAEKKSSPKRAVIVIAAFVISLFMSIIFALIINALNELKDDRERFKKINEGVFGPLKGIFFLKKNT